MSDAYPCCCNVIPVRWCTVWNCQHYTVKNVTIRAESKRLPNVLIIPPKYSSVHPLRVAPHVSCRERRICRPSWRDKRCPHSLPPSEWWLTCSLIYSQRGAEDGLGCVRGGQGSRWCDQHNKEHRWKTGNWVIVTTHHLQLSSISSW